MNPIEKSHYRQLFAHNQLNGVELFRQRQCIIQIINMYILINYFK